MYDNGSGIQQDHQQAMAWYRKAAAAGDQDSAKWIADHPQGSL
jgi:TPR repeat protein